MTTKQIIDLAINAQALSLATQNLKKPKKKKGVKSLVTKGATNIVGVGLIRTQAQLASGL